MKKKSTHVAAIPLIKGSKNIKTLIVNSRDNPEIWAIPKGIKERKYKDYEVAAKECKEEAGLKGVIIKKPVGSYFHPKKNGKVRVKVYVFLVDSIQAEWLEDNERKRKIVSFKKAIKTIKIKSLRKLLKIHKKALMAFKF